MEIRGNDIDPWVSHTQASAGCAFLINIRGVRFVNDVCSILRHHPATMYRGLEGREALLRRIYTHWRADYAHAEFLLDMDTEQDVILCYEILLKRIADRKQNIVNEEAMRDADRSQLANGNEEALRNILRCKICLENQSSVCFQPCQHVCCCGPCGVELNHCPVCRRIIRQRKEIFLS